MMGRSHLTVGACGVAIGTAAGWVPWAQPNVGLIVTGLVMAGAVAPDIDHRTSHISRSWGPATWVLCRVIRFISRRVYLWTRARSDPKNRDPHRTFTHTWPGALLAGGVVAALVWQSQLGAALVIGGLFGAAARCWNRGLQLYAAGLGGYLAWDLWPSLEAAWWPFWLAFSAGCWLHVYSDCVTKAGAPLPFPRVTERVETLDDGTTKVTARRRWHMTGPPEWLRFYAGGKVEPWVLRAIISVTILLVYLLLTNGG